MDAENEKCLVPKIAPSTRNATGFVGPIAVPVASRSEFLRRPRPSALGVGGHPIADDLQGTGRKRFFDGAVLANGPGGGGLK